MVKPHSEDFVKYTFNPEKIKLVIRYKMFELRWEILEFLPKSRLGKIRFAQSLEEIQKLCDDVNVEKNEIQFDRSPRSFEFIIDYYYSKHLHFDSNLCVIMLNSDLIYWGIETCDFDTCCSYRFHQLKQDALDHVFEMNSIEDEENKTSFDEYNNGCCETVRAKIWLITENLSSSFLAKLFTLVSIFFIVISTLTLVLSTLFEEYTYQNLTLNGSTQPILVRQPIHNIFELIEIIYLAWFTFEFILRFWGAPYQLQFLKDPFNIIDLVSIIPFYVSIILSNLNDFIFIHTIAISRIFTIFRVLRICRIFKLARHSKPLRALGKTMKMSMKEFGIMFMFLGLVVLLFSNLLYFAEKDEENSKFTSIPATFWWAVITITTVGYGDIVPRTTIGKVIGSICCISGVLVLAMPISIIVDNFRKISYSDKIAKKSTEHIKDYKKKQKIEMGKK